MTRSMAAYSRTYGLVAFLLLSFVELTMGQSVVMPAPGTPLRKDLMNAIRIPLEKELRQDIVFEVKVLKTSGDWAFGELPPKRKDGKPIDYRKTPYDEAVKEGIFDEGLCVLWQRQKGIWTIKTYVLGATDVPYGCWWKEFKTPKGIFTYAEKNCVE